MGWPYTRSNLVLVHYNIICFVLIPFPVCYVAMWSDLLPFYSGIEATAFLQGWECNITQDSFVPFHKIIKFICKMKQDYILLNQNQWWIYTYVKLYKLDGVGPIDNRPSIHMLQQLIHFFKFFK